MKKSINIFLSKFFNYKKLPNIFVCNLQLNSKLIKQGDLFIAIQGEKLDGSNYILEAKKKGAVSVLTFSKKKYSYFFFSKKNSIYIFCLLHLNKYISEIAGNFYDNPTYKLT